MPSKTGKREAAIGSLAFLGVNSLAAYVGHSETAVRILEITTTPIMGFATAMFGADWVGKQSPWKREQQEEGEDQ